MKQLMKTKSCSVCGQDMLDDPDTNTCEECNYEMGTGIEELGEVA